MVKTPSTKTAVHPSLKLAKLIAQTAENKLGKEIVVLDVRGQSAVTDCFVFVSATSHLHVRSLEDSIREATREAGTNLLRTDGQRGHVWRVLDYGRVLVHIMDEKTRGYYSIERLWDEAKRVTLTKPRPAAKRKKSAKS